MKDEELKKEIQQKFMEMQMTHQQLQQLQQQAQMIEQQIGEVELVQQSLDELSRVKKGTEALVPISSGIFVTTQVQETDKVKVNVGGGTVLEKNIPDTKQMLANQVTEMRKAQKEITKNVEQLQAQAEKIEKELSKLSE